MEIKKIENCDYVMFPRQQRPGLKPKHVEREAFKAELKHIEGHGDYWLLKETFPSFVLLQALMPQNSRLSILILSKNVSMLFTMLCIGGMSMAQSA